MARTKQTACKSDSKGKLIQATYDQPSTEPDSTSTMDRPGQAPTDTDPTQPAQPQGKPTVDPEASLQAPAKLPAKADQGKEEIAELQEEAEVDTEGKASPSTSTTTTRGKCKCDKDEDEESRNYMAQYRAAAEAWKKAVTKTNDKAVAKASYSHLYDALYQQVLAKQPLFTKALKDKVLDSISQQDGQYITDDDGNMFYTERIGEEPCKSAVDRKEEKKIKTQ